MAGFCSTNAKWIFVSMFCFFRFFSVLAFNSGYCGHVTLSNKLQACSKIATMDNFRSSLPMNFGHRQMISGGSVQTSMSNSENTLWKNRGPFTLSKETEWKLTLSLTGPPQDGQFGPGCSAAVFEDFLLDAGIDDKFLFTTLSEVDGVRRSRSSLLQMSFHRRVRIRAPSGDANYDQRSTNRLYRSALNLPHLTQGTIEVDGESRYLNGAKAFWRLDEDPSAQGFDKAGFWIWGLFEEPKYPFMLLQLELTQPIPLAVGEVPAGIIYGQVLLTQSTRHWAGKSVRRTARGSRRAHDAPAAGAGDAGQGAGGFPLGRRRDAAGNRGSAAREHAPRTRP
jgi:hypothetical protein